MLEQFQQTHSNEILSSPDTEIENRAITELEKPIENLLNQIGEKIEHGEYSYLIGDDASGRVPALIFEKIIKEINRKNNTPPPKLYFIAGSRLATSDEDKQLKIDKLQKYLEPVFTKSIDKKQKVLIITDSVVTGSALNILAKVLNQLGIDFDIATIGLYSAGVEQFREAYGEESKDVMKGNIYFGDVGIPSIHKRLRLSGVEKNDTDILSHPLSDEKMDHEILTSSRKDIRTVAEHVYQKYSQKKEQHNH